MGPVAKRKSKKDKKRQPKKGELFDIFTDVEVDEEAGELLIGHGVSYEDGSPLFEIRGNKLVWHIDPDTLVEFEHILEKNGIVDETATATFKNVNKQFWKKLIQGLQHVSQFGDRFARDVLGEPD